MLDKGKTRERPQETSTAFQPVNDANSTPAQPASAALSPARTRSSDGTPSKSRFLRRSRSRQFTEDSVIVDRAAPGASACSTGDATASDLSHAVSASSAPALSLQRSPSRTTLSPPPASPQLASGRQQPDGSNKLGGWLSNMLSSSTSASRAALGPDDSASLRSFSTVGASPSRFLRHSKARDTGDGQKPAPPAATGRLGGLDRMLGRAMQYLTDSDSNADRCQDDIWLLGVKHDGWRSDDPGVSVDWLAPSSPSSRNASLILPVPKEKKRPSERRASKSSARSLPAPNDISRAVGGPAVSAIPFPAKEALARRGSADTASSHPVSRISSSDSARSSLGNGGSPTSPSSSSQCRIYSAQTHGWPPGFYMDFYSRIQLTYRSDFPVIQSKAASPNAVAQAFSSMMSNLSASIGRSNGSASELGAVDGPTTDAGWGCMLRTGQSLLANALLTIHVGRDFRRPLSALLEPGSRPATLVDVRYAAYVRLLTWFLDDPGTTSPFSVHAFAAEGKKLGKEVGEWFGPSTAGGAIKALVTAFEPADLGIVLAMDTTVYQSQVFDAAKRTEGSSWERPVLVLLPLRLGITGVNPIYYASIKQYFTLPQCVGIAGGRPSSSYYFVGCQGDSLFYIDPHYTKPAVRPVPIPGELAAEASTLPLSDRHQVTANGRAALDDFFACSYTLRELDSFHSEKVRKMHISGLDPSMLLGLLCQTREDWQDLCRRMDAIKSTCTPIIHIVPEMPAWMRAPSRSVSTAAVPAAQRRQSGSAVLRNTSSPKQEGNRASPQPDDSFEFADSDDWDIDESDEGSFLDEHKGTMRGKPLGRTPSSPVTARAQQHKEKDPSGTANASGSEDVREPDTPKAGFIPDQNQQ